MSGLGAFDAVVVVMALHHAELDAVTSALAGLLLPQGRLFVYDFDWDAYDDRAAGWLAGHVLLMRTIRYLDGGASTATFVRAR